MKGIIVRNLLGLAGLLIMLVMGGVLLANSLFAPKLQLHGPATVVVSTSGEYAEAGAKAWYKDQWLTGQIRISGAVDAKKPGRYTIRYAVSRNGFTTRAARQVQVVDDVAPVLVLNGANPSNICPHKEYVEPGYAATDDVDGDLTSKVQISASLYEVIYEVRDSSGNTTKASRVINREDKEAPVIELTGGNVMELTVGSGYSEPGYTATDAFDTDIQSKVQVSGDVVWTKAGTYTLTYTATDCSGNVGTAVRTVLVVNPRPAGGVNGSGSTIYLTFDDGPSASITPGVLDILAQEGVRATFFVEGIYADDYGDLMRRIVNEGHTIGIHCYTHNYATVYASVDAYFEDLNHAVSRVAQETGVTSKIIRFPGGSSNTISRNYCPGIMSVLVGEVLARGYHYFDWNVGSGDTGSIGASGVYNNVVGGLKNQGTCVVLMHDRSGNTQTLNALRDIIRYGKSHGYSFDRITMSTPQIHHSVAN